MHFQDFTDVLIAWGIISTKHWLDCKDWWNFSSTFVSIS